MNYMVRLWCDVYNEHGLYQEFVQYYSTYNAALSIAEDTNYGRSMILDLHETMGNSQSHVILYARGF